MQKIRIDWKGSIVLSLVLTLVCSLLAPWLGGLGGLLAAVAIMAGGVWVYNRVVKGR